MGYTVNIMSGYGWIMNTPTITSSTGTTLTTNDINGNSAAYAITAGNEYYIAGSKALMSVNNEWFYMPFLFYIMAFLLRSRFHRKE